MEIAGNQKGDKTAKEATGIEHMNKVPDHTYNTDT